MSQTAARPALSAAPPRDFDTLHRDAVRETRAGRMPAAGIDVFLDPFPQNGGISTFEPLGMGVPVVTRLGDSVPGRVSAAILSSLGLHEWIAATDDDYVRLVLACAQTPQRLKQLRSTLPGIVARSPAGNAAAYTEAVEAAYRAMWRHWCERATQNGAG